MPDREILPLLYRDDLPVAVVLLVLGRVR